MANLSVPVVFTQYSPYMRGNLVYRWFDTDAVTSVTGGNASADGIVSITPDLVGGTLTVQFDSNVDATIDIAGATSSLQFVVPDDYNENIYIQTTIDAEAGTDSATVTPVIRKMNHTFVGVSDSTLTSTPADPEYTETEVATSTTKSLGTFSVNDVDSGATYTATVTYDKTIGSITYSDPSIVTTNTANDEIITSTVADLNTVMSDMQYLPNIIGDPTTNQDALQDQTITLSLKNTGTVSTFNDNRINGQPVTIDTTIDKTLQFTNLGPAPTFNESEGSDQDAVGKSLGTIAISPTFSNPSITFTANVVYNKLKGTMTYPDPSIVTALGDRDQIITSDISALNTALTSGTYVPKTIISGTDLERIEADTVSISVFSTPPLTIATPTTSVTTTVTNQTPEFSGEQAFDYVENTVSTNVLPNLVINDVADNDAGTTEIYAVVIDLSANVGDLVINDTTNIHTYSGTGAEANITANAYIVQGSKANVNAALTSAFDFYPHPDAVSNQVYDIDVYRAPDGTLLTRDINTNYNTFKKIYSGNNFTITNTGTVDTLVVSQPVQIIKNSVDNSIPNTTITADSTGNRDIDLSVTVSTTASLGNGAGEFGDLFIPYLGLSGTTSGSGSGATFDIRKSGNGYVSYGSSPYQPGSGYNIGDTITIAGTDLGGTSPANDCTVTVDGYTGGGAINLFSLSGTANNEWNSSTGVLSYTGTQSEIDDYTANLKYTPGRDTIADSTLTYQIQVQGETLTHSEVRAIDITPVQETGSITLLTDNLIVYDSDNYKSGTPFEFGFSIADPDTANVSSNITATVSLSADIGTITSTAGTFNPSTLEWSYTDSLSSVNNALANLDLNLDSSATATATISVNYVDNQDPGAPISVSLNNAITVRDLDYDPVYMGTRYYQSYGAVDSLPLNANDWYDSYNTQNYVYTSNNSVEVYYDYDTSTETWDKKDTYDITDTDNVTMTTDTSGSLTPYANVYVNYQGSTAATDRVLDNNVINWKRAFDNDLPQPNGPQPWWGTQYARGETDGNKDSYWYLIPHRATQDDFTTNYSNTLGVDAIQFNGDTEKSRIFSRGPNGGTYEQTMSFWVKPNFSGIDVQEQYICTGDGTPGKFNVALAYNSSAPGQIDLFVKILHGATFYTFSATNCLNNNAWNHVVWSIDVESGGTQGPSLAINDSTVTVSEAGIKPSDLPDSSFVTWGARSQSTLFLQYDGHFDGCLAEVVGYNTYLDTSNVTNRRKFITAGGLPATINTSDTGISAYITGGAESWADQLNSDANKIFRNIDDCPPQTLFQSNGSVVVGDFVGADGDCVYDTNASSGTYQQYTSSQTGFNPPVSTEPSRIGFYRFGSPSNGTPTHTGADRDLTYYLSATPLYLKESVTEVRAQTSSTNIQLLAPVSSNQEFSLSGDDTTERVAVSFNDANHHRPFAVDNDRIGELRIMDTSNYGASPLRSITLSTTPIKVNHNTYTFLTDPGVGEGPFWRSHGHAGSQHWFYNNVIAMIDNSGRLVIYKKN